MNEVIEKESVKSLLSAGKLTIKFNKKDGTLRTMKCTLNESLIPGDKLPKTTDSTKPKSETVQTVYDLESDGWRSFTWDSLLSYE